MGATLDETRVELEAQRARVRATAERLELASRHALDLPARIRENPIQTAAIVGGLAFLLLGGPRRVLRQARQTARGSDAERAYAALPSSLRAVIDAAAPGHGDAREEARRQLALALHAWREDPKNRRRAARLASEALSPPGPGRALWSVVEIAGATAAGILVRRTVSRWLTGDPLRDAQAARDDRRGSAGEDERGPATQRPAAGAPTPRPSTTRYAGWSGQRGDPAGSARETQPPARETKPSARRPS
ncbi:MAG: hypothetical protein ACRDFR_04680 [Candidatus Limnocylindria bacterium]